jgi:hypothetical protein
MLCPAVHALAKDAVKANKIVEFGVNQNFPQENVELVNFLRASALRLGQDSL